MEIDKLTLPERKPNRLQTYNYNTAGAYFITMCVKERHAILSEIVAQHNKDRTPRDKKQCGTLGTASPTVALSEYGVIVENALQSIGNNNVNAFVEKYVIMPDHVHFILSIRTGDNIDAPFSKYKQENIVGGAVPSAPQIIISNAPQAQMVPRIMKWFKRSTNKEIGFDIWQRSYYDHIIRDEDEYWAVYRYIENNPAKWLAK